MTNKLKKIDKSIKKKNELSSPKEKLWDLRSIILSQIKKNGGWVNAHAHLDRAYTILPETLHLGMAHLTEKWLIVDDVKRRSSIINFYDRMAFATEQQINQGVSVVGSFIDVDEIVGDKVIKAATKLRQTFGKDVQLIFINQALKGVLNPDAQYWFKEAVQFVDIIGALPAKDKGREEEHLDIVLSMGKSLNKRVHVHVDQLNTATEKETELLVQKSIEHKMQDKVTAIHGVSISAHEKKYRNALYDKMKKAKLSLITCPTAWIDSVRTEEFAPTHNSIAPVEELRAKKITVALGTDNIADVYKPFSDGDMWTELRFLLESCHYYDMDDLVAIVTTNGRKVLGIE